jgi:hypothetical protein
LAAGDGSSPPWPVAGVSSDVVSVIGPPKAWTQACQTDLATEMVLSGAAACGDPADRSGDELSM